MWSRNQKQKKTFRSYYTEVKSSSPFPVVKQNLSIRWLALHDTLRGRWIIQHVLARYDPGENLIKWEEIYKQGTKIPTNFTRAFRYLSEGSFQWWSSARGWEPVEWIRPPIAQVATDLSNRRLRSSTDIIVVQMLAAHCSTYVSSNCKLKKNLVKHCSPRTKNRFTHCHRILRAWMDASSGWQIRQLRRNFHGDTTPEDKTRSPIWLEIRG